MGAASLWMESSRTGEADASKGSSDRAKVPFMIEQCNNASDVLKIRCVRMRMKGDGR